MKRTQIAMNNAVYLGLSMLEESKIVMREFWYDFVYSNYGERAKLYYIDTKNFIVYMKSENICVDILENMLKLNMK